MQERSDQFHRAISVDLPDPGSATALVRELDARHLTGHNTAVIRLEGHWQLVIYNSGPDLQFIVDVLGAIEYWLRDRGLPAARVEVGEKSYLLEAGGEAP